MVGRVRNSDHAVIGKSLRRFHSTLRGAALAMTPSPIGALALAFLLWGTSFAFASTSITNVSAVNVTSSGFSVVWVDSPALSGSQMPAISIFADAGGVTNLAGEIGVEWYPLNSGAPASVSAYQQRLSQAVLRQESQSLGYAAVRISGCLPNSTYYYRVGVSDSNGVVATWPARGPLPAVTTAQQTSFVADSAQLLVEVPPTTPPGSIILLGNSNTPSILAATVGDGAATNQVFFNLSDLLNAAGNSNFTPSGNQLFVVTELGAPGTATQTYDLAFTGGFSVGTENPFLVGDYFSLAVGSGIAQTGHSGSLPIQMLAGIGITNLTVQLQLPTADFSSLSVQLISGQLGSASLQVVNPGLVSINLGAGFAQNLQGAQELAQLNFTVATNISSAFVPVTPLSLQVSNVDGSVTTNYQAQAGQLVIVGQRPLLEALPPTPAGDFGVAVYGNPGTNYELQYTTNLANPAWQNFLSLPLTNLMEVFFFPGTNVPGIFYRAN